MRGHIVWLQDPGSDMPDNRLQKTRDAYRPKCERCNGKGYIPQRRSDDAYYPSRACYVCLGTRVAPEKKPVLRVD